MKDATGIVCNMFVDYSGRVFFVPPKPCAKAEIDYKKSRRTLTIEYDNTPMQRRGKIANFCGCPDFSLRLYQKRESQTSVVKALLNYGVKVYSIQKKLLKIEDIGISIKKFWVLK